MYGCEKETSRAIRIISTPLTSNPIHFCFVLFCFWNGFTSTHRFLVYRPDPKEETVGLSPVHENRYECRVILTPYEKKSLRRRTCIEIFIFYPPYHKRMKNDVTLNIPDLMVIDPGQTVGS